VVGTVSIPAERQLASQCRMELIHTLVINSTQKAICCLREISGSHDGEHKNVRDLGRCAV
jgi:hypothetical protein